MTKKEAKVDVEIGDGVLAMVPVNHYGPFAVPLKGEVIATTARTMTVRWEMIVGEPIEEVVPVSVLRAEHWGLVDGDTGMPKLLG